MTRPRQVFRDPVINAAGQARLLTCHDLLNARAWLLGACPLLFDQAGALKLRRPCRLNRMAIQRSIAAFPQHLHETLLPYSLNRNPSQVYEREAIQRHLSHAKGAAVDPVSRSPLPSRELTPVFILRSRAMEFRESTARRNVERACAPGCPDPVRPPFVQQGEHRAAQRGARLRARLPRPGAPTAAQAESQGRDCARTVDGQGCTKA